MLLSERFPSHRKMSREMPRIGLGLGARRFGAGDVRRRREVLLNPIRLLRSFPLKRSRASFHYEAERFNKQNQAGGNHER